MTASNELLVVRDGTTTEEALELQASSYRPAWAKILKRTIDIVCACLGMMVLAPLMALVAIFKKKEAVLLREALDDLLRKHERT